MLEHEKREALEGFLKHHGIEFRQMSRLSSLCRKMRAHFPQITDQVARYPETWRRVNVERLALLVTTLNAADYTPLHGDKHFVRAKPTPKARRSASTNYDEFLQSREWRELRYSIIVKHGRRCQCCGATDRQIHVDHIKPASKHWNLRLDPNNLQVLCVDCNLGKGNKDSTDWRQRRLTPPERRV